MIIYAHINKINNKVYVGQTTEQDFTRRWGNDGKRYLEKTPKGTYKHPKFAQAIKKYGWNNFEHVVLLECKNNDADYFEKYYITKYDSMRNGYNCTSGGNLKKELSEETKAKLSNSHKKENLSKDSIQNYSNAHKGKSPYNKGKKYNCEKMKGENNPMYGKTPWNKNQGNKVLCENIYTGEKRIFNSAAEAARELGFKNSSPITKCCRGERLKSKNYKFSYLDNNFSRIPPKTRGLSKPVIAYNDTEILEFQSMASAAKELGLVNSTSIRAAIIGRNGQKMAAGYYWKYKNS